MTLQKITFTAMLSMIAVSLISVASVHADDAKKEAKPTTIELAEGKLELTVSGKWDKVKPRSRIVEYEFSVPAVEGDEKDGRVTVMGAGGSIEANIERWVGQFSQPDGGNTKDRAKVDEKKIGGQTVHSVDISGTFDDRPPFAGQGVQREKYRMLALIIETEQLGNYFVKFYGPAATIEANKEAFEEMAKSLQTK